ncbi:hypothetical protein SAMN02745121_03047 [Nannocystis exedens]|uniref:Uncharacterized protein n=1 Tax=Nannocystis exedens TaxID=54 RepID=A0A1I1XSP8_9BACT|nr:hypothetical protein [Nannocystis exedens]PCC73226.1 hypothetical protein NAEX_06314 [Nannocystis exedens]SFE10294.1 hypothetical protein SAMN02745121_03047 [Nannocystis exedens]
MNTDAAPQPKIRWKASGLAMSNRDGKVDMGGTVHVVRQDDGRYTVKFGHKVRAVDLDDLETAKRWASERVATWVSEAIAARKAQEEDTARWFAEEKARQDRRKRVVSELQALGVLARAEPGCIVLDTYVAEDLAERLRESTRQGAQP